MLLVEHSEVFGWEPTIRGARNPLNSWARSDSKWMHQCTLPGGEGKFCESCTYDACRCGFTGDAEFVVGPNDLGLMTKLANAGPDHGKFLRMITVTVDVTAPLYWLKEMDQYKVGVTSNSCSTMHKIHAKEFTMDDFSHEHLFDTDTSEPCTHVYLFEQCLRETIDRLNMARMKFLDTKDKRFWHVMIELLPSSYNQKRTYHMNYAVLKNIYHARKHHKLREWHTFCDWISTLPYAKELIIGEVEE